ncbi:MAG: hypothetical protein HUU38_31220, partial [Anaerolineales bacterium]|nr:hypothetical protein [Anaerolineales bacterium]
PYSGTQVHAVRRVNGSGGSSKTIRISARGTICQGAYPIMQLYVNGTYKTQWPVTNTYANYDYTMILSGSDVIEVIFNNDCYAPPEDRNLYVDYVQIRNGGVVEQTIQAEDGAMVYDKGAGSAAFDGLNVVAANQTMANNGALRFATGSAMALGYDQNGNMTSRVVNGNAYLFTYNAENRITDVNRDGAQIAHFVYDGDGNRVQSTLGTTTTAFVGSHFEWTGSTSTMVKYYYAHGQRLAMRIGTGTGNTSLTYIIGDHLGSTSTTYRADTGETAKQTYKPWGEVRWTSGTLPTDYTFTGQYSHTADFGLMYYVARWYDPALGRFAQADSIVPDAYNPQAYDRFSYGLNNPSRYVDPSGHEACPPKQCGYTHDYDSAGEWSPLADLYVMRLKAQYGLAGGSELATFDGTELFDHPGYDPAEDEFLASVEQGIAENGAYGNLWSLDVDNLYSQYNFYKMSTTGEGLIQFLLGGVGGVGEASLIALPSFLKLRSEVKAYQQLQALGVGMQLGKVTNANTFVAWTQQLEKLMRDNEDMVLTTDQADFLVTMSKQYGVDVILDPPGHSNPIWNGAHLHFSPNGARTHIRVPDGYVLP